MMREYTLHAGRLHIIRFAATGEMMRDRRTLDLLRKRRSLNSVDVPDGRMLIMSTHDR